MSMQKNDFRRNLMLIFWLYIWPIVLLLLWTLFILLINYSLSIIHWTLVYICVFFCGPLLGKIFSYKDSTGQVEVISRRAYYKILIGLYAILWIVVSIGGIIVFGTYFQDYREPAFEESTEIVKCTSETSGIINGYEYVDLGLSVMWATTNLHADNPQDAGKFFQWGNIHDHTHPDGMTYTLDGFFDVGDMCISADEDHDPVRSKMGGRWRIPRKKEIEELCNWCDWELVMIENKRCYKITGLNGNSIILPLAGYYNKNGKYYSQESMYFSGDQRSKEGVYYISITDSVVEIDRTYSEAYYAVPVRAVANLKCMDIWEYLRRVWTGSINPFSRY